MSAGLYLAPDGYDVPTIWQRRPEHPFGDDAVMVRTGANAIAFDALVDLIAEREQVERLVDEFCDYNIGHGDYLSAGRRLRAILDDPSEGGGGEHFPWHYSSFGVACACGEAMDADERCPTMRGRP